MAERKIAVNRVRCLKCGDILTSTHRHHFAACKCGSVYVDGGTDYLRRLWPNGDPSDSYEELSEYWPEAD